MHVLAYLEEQAPDQRVSDTLNGVTTNSDFDEGCPWDNIDGLPVELGNRRPDSDIQSPMRKFMRCPTAEQTNVMYADLSCENLLKANYVGCWGGGVFKDGTPDGNKALSGVFSVVPISAKYPVRGRMGVGKGTKIAEITDGTTNTVMFSEILSFNQTTGDASSTMPFGSNKDVRGAC